MNIWITTAEVAVQPGDIPSGDTLGFITVTMWAESEDDFMDRMKSYFRKYDWEVISVEDNRIADPTHDYGEEINTMIAETSLDVEAVRLGTYYSYKPN